MAAKSCIVSLNIFQDSRIARVLKEHGTTKNMLTTLVWTAFENLIPLSSLSKAWSLRWRPGRFSARDKAPNPESVYAERHKQAQSIQNEIRVSLNVWR